MTIPQSTDPVDVIRVESVRSARSIPVPRHVAIVFASRRSRVWIASINVRDSTFRLQFVPIPPPDVLSVERHTL